MRELNEMQKLAAANQRVLDIQVAANQRLQSQVRQLTERLDAVVDAALAKDVEIGALAGKLAAAQAVVDAARAWAKFEYPDFEKCANEPHEDCGCGDCGLLAALAAHAAQTEAKP